MEFNDKTTTKLKVLKEKIELELMQRKSEKKLAVITYYGSSMGVHVTPEMYKSDPYWKDNITETIEDALEDMDATVSIKINIIPESDYNDINQSNGITPK